MIYTTGALCACTNFVNSTDTAPDTNIFCEPILCRYVSFTLVGMWVLRGSFPFIPEPLYKVKPGMCHSIRNWIGQLATLRARDHHVESATQSRATVPCTVEACIENLST